MHLRWSPEATDDLAEIFAYIAADNERAANRTIRKILKGVSLLSNFPRMGRENRRAGTHELVFPSLPYIAVYRINDKVVIISRIIHGAQDRPTIH